MSLGTFDREALSLLKYVARSPSPYHASSEAGSRLRAVGFQEVSEEEAWEAGDGPRFLVRGGTTIAWRVPPAASPAPGTLIIGAHTDSPNLRVRPVPDLERSGYRQLRVEVYGGPLLNSWLDRDLGLSGRAEVGGADGVRTRLFHVDRPLLRIPQLAVHLDREVNQKGLVLNPQEHLMPLWGFGDGQDFREFLAGELGVDRASIVSWDAMLHPVEPPTLLGLGGELISAPRLDNLASSHCALRTMEELVLGGHDSRAVVLALFDHEEIGSTSASGAAGGLLPRVLERISLSRGWGREAFLRWMAASLLVSVDMAHAVHPNYSDRHEAGHRPVLNGGPVIKVNAKQNYATEAATAAVISTACERAGVPWQWYSHRGDLPCGSTIGPLLASRLGVATVDIGIAQLAMHSARETAGSQDPLHLVRTLLAVAAD